MTTHKRLKTKVISNGNLFLFKPLNYLTTGGRKIEINLDKLSYLELN